MIEMRETATEVWPAEALTGHRITVVTPVFLENDSRGYFDALVGAVSKPVIEIGPAKTKEALEEEAPTEEVLEEKVPEKEDAPKDEPTEKMTPKKVIIKERPMPVLRKTLVNNKPEVYWRMQLLEIASGYWCNGKDKVMKASSSYVTLTQRSDEELKYVFQGECNMPGYMKLVDFLELRNQSPEITAQE